MQKETTENYITYSTFIRVLLEVLNKIWLSCVSDTVGNDAVIREH